MLGDYWEKEDISTIKISCKVYYYVFKHDFGKIIIDIGKIIIDIGIIAQKYWRYV